MWNINYCIRIIYPHPNYVHSHQDSHRQITSKSKDEITLILWRLWIIYTLPNLKCRKIQYKQVEHTFSLLVVENKGLVGDLTSSSIVDQFLAFLVVIVQPPMDEIGQQEKNECSFKNGQEKYFAKLLSSKSFW